MLIAIGANLPLQNRGLLENLRHGVSALHSCDKLRIRRVSGVYSTAPVGGAGRQPRYLNAVIDVEGSIAPGQLLRLLKRIERAAGRRMRGLNAPRPLDLDVLEHGGRCLGWARVPVARRAPRRRAGAIVLPHPELHHRRFVLEPLIELRPQWMHPVLNRTALQLSRRLPRKPGSIRRVLDSGWLLCDTSAEF